VTPRAATLAFVLALAAPAAAAPADLVVRAAPARPLESLRMRVAALAEVDADAPDADAPDAVAADPGRLTQLVDLLGRSRTLEDKVVFRFNLGFGLDGGQLWRAPADEQAPAYQAVRIYGFGDAVLGSRGLGVPSLSTYMAANFRLDEPGSRRNTAVPSIYDGDGVGPVLVRSGYAELDGFLRHPLLHPVYVRAGRQFRYGPAIAHFDGLTVGYDTRAVSAGLYAGVGVSLHGFDRDRYLASGGALAGGNLRVDLHELWRLPLVMSGSGLRFDGRQHLEGGLALRWGPDVLVRGSVRLLDGAAASHRLSLRARISEVSTVSAEVENRTSADWRYDLILIGGDYDATDPRRYLDLGPPLPRMLVNLRAGTVLLDNVDVLIRGGGALERGGPDQEPSAFSPSYVEGGSALEVRIRRAVAIGASMLARRYQRDEPDAVDTPADGVADPLPAHTGAMGEVSFVEGGGRLQYRQGARRFSATAEVYTRTSRRRSPYVAVDDERLDVRGGGRFGVEGWAGDNLRLKAEYDVSTPMRAAPELRGLKSLRVFAEGHF
jgi:hypothetical protein